jgi:hypothetical protein
MTTYPKEMFNAFLFYSSILAKWRVFQFEFVKVLIFFKYSMQFSKLQPLFKSTFSVFKGQTMKMISIWSVQMRIQFAVSSDLLNF